MGAGEVQKSSHCAWQIHYHIVFPVKYRKALLSEEVVGIIVDTAKGISERYDIEMETIGCDRDHIHLLCTAHPKISPGQIVRVFKSITAREIFLRKPEVNKGSSLGIAVYNCLLRIYSAIYGTPTSY